MALTPSPINAAYARAQLAEWLAALEEASLGGSYSIGNRQVTRRDITEIRGEIQRWHNTIAAIEERDAGRQRPMFARASFPAPGTGTGSSHHPWLDGSN